ncbi:MAG TPA: hypothetical protein ENO08_06720 [Candidatus Eisenbacteria bacterium]|uniref:Uncharacterized protein n=1 Tax=Eiseniibacteriota bacterium TaxID=2212470 RepID=A0A7V2AVS5_UNCEI|nr:hypothetical protein [Candidatus Eisenbacteria bacterium]
MFVSDLLLAAGTAILLTVIFAIWLGRRGPWAKISVFFLVVFLASWAAGKYMDPIGPPIVGSYWLPFMLFGLVIALLMAASMPFTTPSVRRNTRDESEEGVETQQAVFNAFFWILLILLLALIIAAYF